MTFVLYGASHCGMCAAMKKILNDIPCDSIIRNVENHEDLVKKLGIKGVPTLMLYKDSQETKELRRWCGVVKKEDLLETLEILDF